MSHERPQRDKTSAYDILYNKRIKNQNQPTLEEKEIYLQDQMQKDPVNSQLEKVRSLL